MLMIRSAILFTFFISFFAAKSSELDSLLTLLDDEIKNKSKYEQIKKNRIDAIFTFLKQPSLNTLERFRYNKLLIKEYEKYSFDSTIFYIQANLNIAKALGRQDLLNESFISLGAELRTVGRSKEAENILSKVDTSHLSFDQKISFYNAKRNLFGHLFYTASTNNFLEQYLSSYNQNRTKLLKILPEDHDIRLEIKQNDLFVQWLPDEYLELNQLRLNKTSIGMPLYSLVTFERFLIYDILQKPELKKKYLILSAISDIRAVVMDNASLTIIADILYKEGDVERAYYYIQSSFEDAIQYNSMLRFEQISKTLSPITRSYQQLSDEQKNALEMNVLVISMLSIVLLITIFLIYRQVKKVSIARNDLRESLEELNMANEQLKTVNNKQELLYNDLSESSLVKEHYIANFLNIHSEYIDKIDKYQKLVKRMLIGRKYEQLLDQINSRQFVDAEIKSFYKTFDEAFLTIYPEFIPKFNDLLKEGQAIQLSEGELLNSELRVFALIRLGISDSSTIAKVLRYSVTTIYNLRVKIKNKARVDRAEFEQMVQKIDAF